MKKFKFGLYFCVISTIAFSFQACESSSRVSSRNLSTLYTRQNFNPDAQFRFYHFSKDSSEINYSISKSDLLYIKTTDGQNESINQITWKLYAGYDTRHLLDSASFIFKDYNNLNPEDKLTGKFKIKIPKTQSLLCEIKVTDLNRNSENIYLVESTVDSLRRSRDHYKIMVNDFILMDNYLSSEDTFRIVNSNGRDKILVRYYNREFPLPTPPFSLERLRPFEYNSDSVFEINSVTDTILTFPQSGFYHFQSDSSDRIGFTVFRFADDYPKMTDALSLLYPIRYISTRKEHEGILMSNDKKAALDEYWLSLGGSQERARELIKHFYSRVQDSNRYFSCHTEGWKTDRGLIYIVFGKPNSVYKNSLSETWIYGSGGNSLSVSFNFEKVKNPFSNNDYQLQRSPSYEMTWYTAVESWRQGRAFNQK